MSRTRGRVEGQWKESIFTSPSSSTVYTVKKNKNEIVVTIAVYDNCGDLALVHKISMSPYSADNDLLLELYSSYQLVELLEGKGLHNTRNPGVSNQITGRPFLIYFML